MLPFFRPKTQKDFAARLYGKPRRYRLSRNGAAVAVTGTLLAHYRRDTPPDGLMPPAAGRVELLAVLYTAAGRFVVYYVVTYPETEDIAGRHEYVHACPTLAAVRDFLAAMHYPSKAVFADTVLATAAAALGVPAPEAVCPPPPDTAEAGEAEALEAVEASEDAAEDAGADEEMPPAAGRGTAPPGLSRKGCGGGRPDDGR